jgi:DNA-binding CsgD family transcriptional regulator
MVKVKLTLFDHEDIQVLKLKGGQAYTIKVLIRIAREAIEQGGVLSNEDIQFLLRLSPRTIVRYKHMILQKGERIILRGDSQDMGPGKSHRIQIISLFLQGYSETEISQRMNHTLESVEMYVYDFLRVSLMYRDGYEPGIIARVAKLSKGKIYAVLELYEHFSKDDFYSSSLDNVLEIFELKRQFKKGGALI